MVGPGPSQPWKVASWREIPSVKYGSFFFPFSSTSVRALSLSFSPLPLPIPKCSWCSAGPGSVRAEWGFSPLSGRHRSAEHCVPGSVCSHVRVCARKSSEQLRPRAVALSLLPSFFPPSVFRPPSVPCPSSIQLKGSLTLFSFAETVRGALLPGPHWALLFPTALPQHSGPEGVHALQRPQAQDQ